MLAKLLERFRGDRRQAQPELRGRPQIRREKAYASDSGYVYQYTYEGYRPTDRDGVAGTEFVFACTSDRADRFRLTVFAPDQSFSGWEQAEDRELSEVERYAIVKMQLFAIFDESEHLQQDDEWQLGAEQVRRHIADLDL